MLQEDASLSVAEIGNRVGLSSTPCWKRIQRLEAEGVIQKRVARGRPDKVGLGITVFVSIETGDHSEDWLGRFAEAVQRDAGGDGILPDGRRRRLHAARRRCPTSQATTRFYKKLIAAIPLKNVTSRFAMEKIKSDDRAADPVTGWPAAFRSARVAADRVGQPRPHVDLVLSGSSCR